MSTRPGSPWIEAAKGFVGQLPDEFKVGLVAFDGSARVLAAPTTDHQTVIAAIANLTTGRSTAGGDAIDASLASIRATLAAADQVTAAGIKAVVNDTSSRTDGSPPPATIVILSDGATTKGVPILEAAKRAAAVEIPVSTITYGTATGTVTVQGQSVQVPPDTQSMAAVAELTGGSTFEAATADQLRTVYQDIQARVGTTQERRELTLWFVGAAFAALLVAVVAGFVWTGRFL